jgi:hypothetical protein
MCMRRRRRIRRENENDGRTDVFLDSFEGGIMKVRRNARPKSRTRVVNSRQPSLLSPWFNYITSGTTR